MITSESLIDLNLKSTNKTEIIENLAKRAKKAGRISDINMYMQAVWDGEERYPTVIGYGIAIPYGESSCVRHPFIAFARSNQSFLWDDRTDLGAKLIFLLGVPEGQDDNLIFRLLSLVNGIQLKKIYRNLLLQATSAAEVVAIFKEMEL